jgi:hypothetical protein
MLQDLYVRMSHNEARDSNNAFRLLKSSMDEQKQLRQSATLNPESPGKDGMLGERPFL